MSMSEPYHPASLLPRSFHNHELLTLMYQPVLDGMISPIAVQTTRAIVVQLGRTTPNLSRPSTTWCLSADVWFCIAGGGRKGGSHDSRRSHESPAFGKPRVARQHFLPER
ncbi:hypothetical protein GSI_05020 [Ganoderma sinense ZZ0214-1]|uniref:Uncharacterized protein n=1 Tax=Ganoderma sinense ZZ0214-1 TaxID=1077348 RepID=A0A2G8SGM1_9APHY|nr:hypothetical protein GSI_05020 [Ganoderma sinense ZZ0214-1]